MEIPMDQKVEIARFNAGAPLNLRGQSIYFSGNEFFAGTANPLKLNLENIILLDGKKILEWTSPQIQETLLRRYKSLKSEVVLQPLSPEKKYELLNNSTAPVVELQGADFHNNPHIETKIVTKPKSTREELFLNIGGFSMIVVLLAVLGWASLLAFTN